MSKGIFDFLRAKKMPVGRGRGNPNQDPFLPPPIGRFEFTWNPFKLLVRDWCLFVRIDSLGLLLRRSVF
jgi:hypothetical protein